MQATLILLVSTIFMYSEICGTLSNSKRACAEISTRRTLLKPYMSKYDEFFKDIQQDSCRNKSRDVLSAVLVKTFKAPFSPENWGKIINPILPKDDKVSLETLNNELNENFGVKETLSAPVTSNNLYMSDFKETKNTKYQMISDNGIYYNILDNLFSIVVLEIDEWLKTKQVDKIENYFGFKPDMVDLINISMTELMSQQRKGIMDIQDYLKTLYIILDIENVVVEESDTEREQKISKQFNVITNWFRRLPEFEYQFKCMGMSKFKEDLINSIKSIGEKTNSSFGVSVSSMKMRLLIKPTDNEALKIFQNLKPFPFDQRTVSEYVKSYAQEVDACIVNEYHVSILSVLITHVFGFVHNHFKLLLKLQKYEINDVDKNTIGEFSTFMNAYMSILIDRYFEFKGEISQGIVDAMFSIMFFLNPSDPQQIDGKDFTEKEKEILNAPAKPTVSILNYYDGSKNQRSIEIEMKKLVNEAVNVLIETFIGPVTDDILAKWNKELEINFKEEFPNKLLLIEAMKNNNKNAFSILTELSCEFTV